MTGTVARVGQSGGFNAQELEALQSELAAFEKVERSYPLACAIGSWQLLFESRHDVELLVENLAAEISAARNSV